MSDQSGRVQWLPLKSVATLNDDVIPEDTDPDQLVDYIEISDVSLTTGISGYSTHSFAEAPSRARRVIRTGDVLVGTVRTYLRAIAPVLKSQDGMIASTGFAVVRPRRAHPAFVRYALLSNAFVDEVIARSTGVSYPAISSSEIGRVKIPVPESFEEQRRIAEFLDRETAQIDELIAKQEQLISTLAERRTSVILNGVARGLSGVDLKESGADWLGKVPAHWRVRRLKYSVRFSKNGVWGDEPDGGESDVWVIRVADFDRVRRTVTKDKQTYRKVLSSDRTGRLLSPGDLVLEKSGGGEKSPVGFVAIYEDSEPALTSNFVARMELESDCDSRYWLYVHAALYASRVTERSIKQTSGIQNLDQSSYFNELAPFPPLEEQRSIAREIDTRLDAILSAVKKADLLIDRLRERRQALISAAVTGQIDAGGAS